MANDSGEFQYSGNGSVYVAPVGTAMPTLTTTALNAAFIQTGYATEDGFTITPTDTVEEVMSWQSDEPTDFRLTRRALSLNFTLQQQNDVTWNFAFGGTWAANSTEWKWTPPAAGVMNYRAVIIESIDGSDTDRFLFPKVLPTVGEMVFRRNQPAPTPITLQLINTGVGNSWNHLSTRAEFNPA